MKTVDMLLVWVFYSVIVERCAGSDSSPFFSVELLVVRNFDHGTQHATPPQAASVCQESALKSDKLNFRTLFRAHHSHIAHPLTASFRTHLYSANLTRSSPIAPSELFISPAYPADINSKFSDRSTFPRFICFTVTAPLLNTPFSSWSLLVRVPFRRLRKLFRSGSVQLLAQFVSNKRFFPNSIGTQILFGHHRSAFLSPLSCIVSYTVF